MIITIRKDDGTVTYNTSMIEDDNNKNEANTMISKIGTLNVVVEALNFASDTHQNNLTILLQNSEEAMVEEPAEPVEEEVVVEEESTDES
jgi:hypothetical protein|tara:strand:- start:850 stop:1119 length:270 start_codon:yes stop_codon:yes gene_type:complete